MWKQHKHKTHKSQSRMQRQQKQAVSNHNHSANRAAPANTTASAAPTTLWLPIFVPALVVLLPAVDEPLAAVPVDVDVPECEDPAPVLVEPEGPDDEAAVAVGILEMVDHVPPVGRH